MNKKTFLILFLILGIHLFLLSKLQFTAWPEMLSYPYLKNNGFLLYRDMIHPYPPVLTIFLSIVFKIFGYKLVVLKIVTWLIIFLNDILIFKIVKKISGSYYWSFLSLTFYLLVQPFLEGNQLWFDLAIVPSLLFSFLLFLNQRFLWAGFFLGLAILTKQTAGLFLIFWSLFIFWREKSFKSILLLVLGPIFLFSILLIKLITDNVLVEFFNWTLIFPFTLWSKFPGYVQMALTGKNLAISGFLVAPVLFLIVIFKSRLVNQKNFFYLLFNFLISGILIYPRFSFFHFQLGLAFLAIIYGFILSQAKVPAFLWRFFFVTIFSLISLPVFIKNFGKETRFWSKKEVTQSEIITRMTNPEDKIYLSGLPSNLYVLAGRLPPKIWADNFGWYLEIPGIQEKIIENWKKIGPKMVFSKDPLLGNWFDLGTYRPDKIMEWVRNENIQNCVLE